MPSWRSDRPALDAAAVGRRRSARRVALRAGLVRERCLGPSRCSATIAWRVVLAFLGGVSRRRSAGIRRRTAPACGSPAVRCRGRRWRTASVEGRHQRLVGARSAAAWPACFGGARSSGSSSSGQRLRPACQPAARVAHAVPPAPRSGRSRRRHGPAGGRAAGRRHRPGGCGSILAALRRADGDAPAPPSQAGKRPAGPGSAASRTMPRRNAAGRRASTAPTRCRGSVHGPAPCRKWPAAGAARKNGRPGGLLASPASCREQQLWHGSGSRPDGRRVALRRLLMQCDELTFAQRN